MQVFLDVLGLLFKVFFFPGLAFTLVVSFLLAGLDRKLVARMQRRVGPPLLQPVYDYLKCLGKETIIPRKANRAMFLAAPLLGVASVLVTALFIPVGGAAAFSANGDTVVVLYLLTLASVTVIMGSAASGSPFAGVGLSREMVSMISYELPFVLVLLAVGRVAGAGTALGVTFSFADIAAYQAANGVLLGHVALLPAALAMLLVIPCEVGQQPFDIDEAETEICEGVLAEYSGHPLARYKLMHNVKMFVMSGLFCALFLNIQTGFLLLDGVIFAVLCCVVTFLSMSVPHAVCARFKVEQVFKFYWTIVAGLAAVSLALVWLGL
ncbi:MAG: NADH-quinone oxidoreductase subunit H [Gemmiger sp.]|nr:NADH-quinone oxidoreductase subunit H [Gemmiger sp.]